MLYIWIHKELNMCSLNAYLHKINLTDTPKCLCGAKSATVEHFLLYCPLHAQPRRDLLHSTLPLYDKLGDNNITLLSFLLHGSCELSLENNVTVFKAVGNFITQSGRF